MKLTYLGHSAFEIKTDNHTILIDPFLVKSPDYDYSNVSDIFLTHGHSDHVGKAPQIANDTGAVITAVFELAKYCARYGVNVNGISLGGWINYEWGRCIAVPAFHSSSADDGTYTGCPVGYVFDIDGTVIYHAGDTCLNSEMKVIGEVYKPDIALLPVGGHYTMDVENAAVAAEWLGAKTVIPMHFNTFPQINADTVAFEAKIKNAGKTPLVMKTGQVLDI